LCRRGSQPVGPRDARCVWFGRVSAAAADNSTALFGVRCCLPTTRAAAPTRSLPGTLSQARGADALAALAARRASEAHADELAARVRSRLRLRRMAKDPLLPLGRFEAACGTLLRHAAALQPHAEGLSLRVSDANRVEGQYVDVAWDAEP
jgi:hypothetical protein